MASLFDEITEKTGGFLFGIKKTRKKRQKKSRKKNKKTRKTKINTTQIPQIENKVKTITKVIEYNSRDE